MAEEFLNHGRSKRGRELRPATVKEYRRALLTYAKALHEQPVSTIRRADVARVIDALAAQPVTAMRTRAALSRFWSWLLARGHVEANIVTGTEGYSTPKRERVLTDIELAGLWQATAAPGDFNAIIRLCLLLGCRRSEAGAMCWSELADGVWTVPGSKTKNHRPLQLPLPRQAHDVLTHCPRVLGKATVFGRGPNGFQAWSKAKERLDGRLGWSAAWDLHDLRRSVQTRMSGLGVNRDLVNRVLNHAMSPIDEAYDLHSYLPEKAAALQRWADALDRIVAAGAPAVLVISAKRLKRK